MQENNWNQSYNQNQQPNYGQPMPPYGYREPERKGFAIASLVLGILSLVLCCIYGGFLGILGLIFGIVSLAKKESKMGMAIAGIITSAFGLVYGILMVMATVMTIQFGIENIDEDLYQKLFEEVYGIESTEQGTIAESENAKETETTETTENTGKNVAESDPFAGNAFVMGDESVIYFEKDGTFVWYKDDSDHEDYYYTGTYDSYQAELAESYIVTYLGEYGVTEEELAGYYERNEDSEFYSQENFTCLVLHNESAICDGKEQLVEPYDTNYMGFYMDGYYDAANMASGEYVAFTMR